MLIIVGVILLFNVLLLVNDLFMELVIVGVYLFSIFLTLLFFVTTLALLRYNWYLLKIFVGDMYMYFVGMMFGVVGMFGYFSEMLLLFFFL